MRSARKSDLVEAWNRPLVSAVKRLRHVSIGWAGSSRRQAVARVEQLQKQLEQLKVQTCAAPKRGALSEPGATSIAAGTSIAGKPVGGSFKTTYHYRSCMIMCFFRLGLFFLFRSLSPSLATRPFPRFFLLLFSFSLSIYIYIYLSICLCIYLSVYLSNVSI